MFPSFLSLSAFLSSSLTQVSPCFLTSHLLSLSLSDSPHPLVFILSLKLEPELSRRQGPTPDSHSSFYFYFFKRRSPSETVLWCELSPQPTSLALLSCSYELLPGVGLPRRLEMICFRDKHLLS